MKLDLKDILIIALGVGLVLMFIFRPSKEIETYEDEIEVLKKENEKLLNSNDSIIGINDSLSTERDELTVKLDSTEVEINKSNDRINVLENGKSEVSSYVNGLDADGVANGLSEYIENRRVY